MITQQAATEDVGHSYATAVAEINKAVNKRKADPNYLPAIKMKRLAETIVRYCELQANMTMHWYQREWAERVVYSIIIEDGEEITALFSRQSGKTEGIGILVAGLIVILPLLASQVVDPRLKKFEGGFWVGIFAPTYNTAGILGKRIRQRLFTEHSLNVIRDEIGLDMPDKKRRQLALDNGSKVECFSGKTNTTIEGETFHLLIIEECQAMDSKLIRKSIHPMGAATLATLVKIGTPNMEKSEFYEACQRNRRLDIGKNKWQRRHFQYDYLVAAKENSRYAVYIQQEMERLGFESDAFRMAYRLHWLLERGVFMSEDLFNDCGVGQRRKMIRRKGAVIESSHILPCNVVTYDQNRRCAAGIDFGKTEHATVVTIVDVNYAMEMRVDGQLRYHKHVLNWLELKGDDHEAQLPQIIDFLNNYNGLEILCADATGVGDPIVSRLKNILRQRRIRVIPFVFGGKTKDIGYRLFLQELTAGRFTWPMSRKTRRMRKFQNFLTQFIGLTKRYQGNRLVVEKPKEQNAHDDFPDSAMLANYAATARVRVNASEETQNPFFSRGVRGLEKGRRRNAMMGGRQRGSRT